MRQALKLGDQPRPPPAGAAAPSRWEDLPVPPAGEPCRDRPEGEVQSLQDPYLAGYTLEHFPRLKRLLWAVSRNKSTPNRAGRSNTSLARATASASSYFRMSISRLKRE